MKLPSGHCPETGGTLGHSESSLVYSVGSVAESIVSHFTTVGSSIHLLQSSTLQAQAVYTCVAVWTIQRVALLHGTIHAHLMRTPRGESPIRVSVALSPLGKKIGPLRKLLWRCCDEYMSIKHKTLNGSMLDNMRYIFL